MTAFYVPLADRRYRATERTSGPWDPAHQHAGPPSALLLRAFEQEASELVIARFTVEILGPVPIGEMVVETTVERPGRSVELLAGSLSVGGREAMRARAWRVRPAPLSTEAAEPPGLPEEESVPPPVLGETFGYAHSIEWRWVRGQWQDKGPATVWTRTKTPLVDGEEPSPRQRVMAVADSASGVSSVLDWGRYLFVNTELTVHFLREPVGEWVLLDAATQIAEGGAGLASSVLSDRTGPVARGAQALLVAPR
jgi:Thioesterase-like superfamily